MNSNDEETERPEPLDHDEVKDTGFTGGGGPASVIYGDDEDDEVDEAAEEMLKAPDESD